MEEYPPAINLQEMKYEAYSDWFTTNIGFLTKNKTTKYYLDRSIRKDILNFISLEKALSPIIGKETKPFLLKFYSYLKNPKSTTKGIPKKNAHKSKNSSRSSKRHKHSSDYSYSSSSDSDAGSLLPASSRSQLASLEPPTSKETYTVSVLPVPFTKTENIPKKHHKHRKHKKNRKHRKSRHSYSDYYSYSESDKPEAIKKKKETIIKQIDDEKFESDDSDGLSPLKVATLQY